MPSRSLLKRFVKDYNLPIVTLDEDHFMYFLKLYNPLYKTMDKYSLLEQTVGKLGSEEDFFEASFNLQNQVIDHIKNKSVYDLFLNYDMNKFKRIVNFPENKLYQPDNADCIFISIDMIKANFQAMKFFSNILVDGCDSYEKFISQFTDLEYFIKSKQIRQVIFGNLNPKRQQTIQKYMMSIVTKSFIDAGIGDEIGVELYSMSTDELILKVYNLSEAQALLNNINFNDIGLSSQIFTLEKVHDNKNYYVKNFLNRADVEFKCVPNSYFAQVYKYYYSLEPRKYDFDFMFEGKLARFIEPVYNDFYFESI